ncbi:MAG: DinB family protein [Acidobacteriota bacterium]
MTELQRIAGQLTRSLHGPAWHGPALLELLDGVSASEAAAPRGSVHSIWELTSHVTTWLEVLEERLAGKGTLGIPQDRNFPPVGAPTAAWAATLARLREAAVRLGGAIDALSASRFDDPLPGVEETWSVYESLHGAVQHTIYHAGQIAILRKL